MRVRRQIEGKLIILRIEPVHQFRILEIDQVVAEPSEPLVVNQRLERRKDLHLRRLGLRVFLEQTREELAQAETTRLLFSK